MAFRGNLVTYFPPTATQTGRTMYHTFTNIETGYQSCAPASSTSAGPVTRAERQPSGLESGAGTRSSLRPRASSVSNGRW
jgi:hypothetical protein